MVALGGSKSNVSFLYNLKQAYMGQRKRLQSRLSGVWSKARDPFLDNRITTLEIDVPKDLARSR